jgi:hypothetical protein
MEPEGSLPRLQMRAACHYPEPDQSSLCPSPVPVQMISGENLLYDEWIQGFRYILNSLRLEYGRFLISVQDIRTWLDNTDVS